MHARDFRRLCHHAADGTGGKVAGFRIADGVTPNFHQGVIAYPDRTVAVVCRRESVVLAVAEPHDAGPLTFAEEPELAACLAALSGVRALTKTELNGPFDVAEWPDVAAADVAYWRPDTLGEALFNYWD